MIVIDNIRKSYGDNQVLNITGKYKLEANKIHGILGSNGCGKTTLLKIVAGLDEDYEGYLEYDIQGFSKQDITYVKQQPYMINASVMENIIYPLKLRGVVDREKIVDSLIEEFNLKGLIRERATRLSSGETQRVAIARALSFKPRLLILDEPLANLDPEYIEIIERAVLSRVRNDGLTVIIVTHNIRQASRLCDRIYYMNNGEIVEYGQRDVVLSKPRDSRTKKFLSFA